jgi:hypothetical protein
LSRASIREWVLVGWGQKIDQSINPPTPAETHHFHGKRPKEKEKKEKVNYQKHQLHQQKQNHSAETSVDAEELSSTALTHTGNCVFHCGRKGYKKSLPRLLG